MEMTSSPSQNNRNNNNKGGEMIRLDCNLKVLIMDRFMMRLSMLLIIFIFNHFFLLPNTRVFQLYRLGEAQSLCVSEGSETVKEAGAKHVYAVEASEMADYAQKLIAGNPLLAQRITVIKGKVEGVELPKKANILISKPMGTLLVNERMLESYVIASDCFPVPNGKKFPSVGRS